MANLMEWLSGGKLEVEIRRAIMQEMREDEDDPEYATALSDLEIALSLQGRHAEALDCTSSAERVTAAAAFWPVRRSCFVLLIV